MRRFEFSGSTSNKFWEVEVKGKTLNINFGKIGTKGQSKPKDFATPEKAKTEMEKLIKEKTGKGYVEVGGKAVKAAKSAAGKKTNAGSMGEGLSKAEKKAKAEKVLSMFADGQWELAHDILEAAKEEDWLFQELLEGCKIEDGEIKPSPLVIKYFKNLKDPFGNSRNNGEMVTLGVLLKAPKETKKRYNLETKSIKRVSCIPCIDNLEYFGHIHESFSAIREWRISPDNNLFEIKSLGDSAAKLLSQWRDMESVGFDNLANLSDKAMAFLCKPCPEYLSLPALKSLSGAAANSFIDLLKRGAIGIYLNGLKNLSDEAVVIISKSKYYFSDNSGGLVIPEKLQKIVEEFKEKQAKKK